MVRRGAAAGWADELSGRPGATDSAVVAMVSVMAVAVAVAVGGG